MWIPSYDYLEHHGIPGQKWGVRRFQYEDGRLTPAGKERYEINPDPSKPKERRTFDVKPHAALRSKTSSNILEKAMNGISEGLGIDARARWQNAQDWTDYSDYDPGSWSGSAANFDREQIERLEAISERRELTDEEKEDLEGYKYIMELHNTRIAELQEKANEYAEQYKKTPLGWLETTFNQAVDTGKQFVDTASSSISDFFKNLF